MIKKTRHKFGAKRSKIDAINFDSKLEAAYYNKLKILQSAGEVVFFLRQPMFDLGGGVTYKADFAVYWATGNVSFVDVKGVETKDFIMKKKLVESLYPISIDVIKKV